MIDTIRFKTPYITSEEKLKVAKRLKYTRIEDLEKGLIIKESFSGRAPTNTYHYSIYVMVKETRLKSVYVPSADRMVCVNEECEPYLIIECSLAKFLQGHNIFSGTDDIKNAQLIIDYLCEYFDIKSIDINDCTLARIDISYSYQLNDCVEYLRTLNASCYSRRKRMYFEDECVYFPGSTTTLKFYNKYEEFKKHDYKKLQDEYLLNRAENVLRVETEFKMRKLKVMFECLKIRSIDMGKLLDGHFKEVGRVYNNVDLNRPIINHEDVKRVLISNYGVSLGISLHSSYMTIIEHGKKKLMEDLPKSTFYYHMKKLKLANININENAVVIIEDKCKREFNSFYPSATSERII